MGEIKSITDHELVSERTLIKEDVYEGQALEILILLLKGEKTAGEIARVLDIPIFSVYLYLNRLQKFNLVTEACSIQEGKTIEKVYKLTTTKLDIVTNKKMKKKDESANAVECEEMAAYFNKLSAQSIGNIYKYPNEPYLIKACFITANSEKMRMFQEKLNALIDEFNELEESEEKMTFGLIVDFTPFEFSEGTELSV